MVWITTDVEVDLDCFDDEDIRDEYERRNLGNLADDWDEQVEMERVHRLHHQGKNIEAYDILWKMCLIKLNKIV
jgi:hypothetical protein